ncbi:MAG: nucleotide kinase [Ruminococcaceae bacterium]|nr:nucleotide kinase [Oscillospiraceae bacterium]
MKKLYLVGGTMGVGKTTVCQRLKKKLANAVFLDGDWCWDADPFQVTEETKKMVTENICFLLNNFLRTTAYENIIFCWVMHEQAIIDSILQNLNTENIQTIIVSLTADSETLRERLLKDIRLGARKEDIIKRSTERLPLYNALNTIKIDTSGKTPDEIAEEIIGIG